MWEGRGRELSSGLQARFVIRATSCWAAEPPQGHTPTNLSLTGQVASHGELSRLRAFFTISTTGVTRTLAQPAQGTAATEFLTLAQFRREARLHARLMQMHVFR